LSSSPSPDYEGFATRGVLDKIIFVDSPALRRGSLSFGSSLAESSSYPPGGRVLARMQVDSVMHDIIAAGSVAGAPAGAGYYIGGDDAEHRLTTHRVVVAAKRRTPRLRKSIRRRLRRRARPRVN
jgi:hypothetical protein